MKENSKRGQLIIISSPSGGGKDAVIRALLKIFPGSARLVTTTSRPMRPHNIQGVDYHFINKKEFEDKIKNNEFLENNFYAGNYYGLEKTRLSEALASHDLVFTQIEVNGKNNLDKAKIPNLSIFLLPNSLEILKKRIEKRGGISPEVIEERLRVAEKEIKESKTYDYRVMNQEGKLLETVDNVAKIIRKQLKKPQTLTKNVK